MKIFVILGCLLLLLFPAWGKEKEVHLNLLSGTLLQPDSPANSSSQVAIFICGSGPTDRNGNNPQMQNNCIRETAEALQHAGIASLRYDKRGIAASSNAMAKEEDLRLETYVEDVKAWIRLLKEQYAQVILIGHSEGALIGTLAAIENPNVQGLVLMAGPGEPADLILKRQLAAQAPALLLSAESIIDSLKEGNLVSQIPPPLLSLFRPSVQPYLISWFAVDPAASLSQVKCAALILQGDHDIQVSVQDAERLSKARKDARKVIVPNMNHILKRCSSTNYTAQLATYNNPDLPIVPAVSTEIIRFIYSLK